MSDIKFKKCKFVTLSIYINYAGLVSNNNNFRSLCIKLKGKKSKKLYSISYSEYSIFLKNNYSCRAPLKPIILNILMNLKTIFSYIITRGFKP